MVFFFFQAEDGIRGTSVTGVQTCALPILLEHLGLLHGGVMDLILVAVKKSKVLEYASVVSEAGFTPSKIGRASCRERAQISVVHVAARKKSGGMKVENAKTDRLSEQQPAV